MTRILFQGDSITDGNRLKPVETRWDLNHQIGHSYVYHIVGTLGRRFPGRYTFINRGVSGDSVSSIAERWQRDTLEEHPDILSMLLGINGNLDFDGCYPEGVEQHLAQFDAGYRELLDTALSQNPQLKLILIEPFALPVGRIATHYDDFMAVFARKQAIVQRIAQAYQGVFVPVQKPLEELVAQTAPQLLVEGCPTDPYAYWMWDGIHPTESLHHYLAELWLSGFETLTEVQI